MTDDMTSKVPMRKPSAVPKRTPGRVSFLEGWRGSSNDPVHVEDKLVQSSGPSGRMKEWTSNWDRVLNYIRQADPPGDPVSHTDFTNEANYVLNSRGQRVYRNLPRTHVHVDRSGKWYVLNSTGERVYYDDTPPQRQEAPPTSDSATPSCKGTYPPLQHQLALPFPPAMQYIDLSVFADNKLKLHVDFAEAESRTYAALLHYTDHPAPWRYGRSPAEPRRGHVMDPSAENEPPDEE